jgi:hypothetical protein
MVDQNPVLPMLQLEDPKSFGDIQLALINGWRSSTGIEALSLRGQQLLMADCAEHVVHVYEAWAPGDQRPRRAISVGRRFAQGKASEAEIKAAFDEMFDLGNELDKKNVPDSVRYAINAAISATSDISGFEVAMVVDYSCFAIFGPERKAEFEYQAKRVRHYYALEHPEYQKADFIGAKKEPAWSNPSTLPKDLERLAKSNKKTYMNPNLTWEQLLKGASLAPWMVEQNPALALLSIEDPNKYNALWLAIAKGWISSVKKLSEKHRWEFARDCAGHILPIFEKKFPGETAPRIALDTLQDFIDGKIFTEILRERAVASAQVGYRLNFEPFARSIMEWSSAPLCVAYACGYTYIFHDRFSDSKQASKEASWWGIKAMYGAPSEILWQAGRARHYYALEHPEYQPPEQVGGKRPPSVVKQRHNCAETPRRRP